jgi:Receptor family ligand binding region
VPYRDLNAPVYNDFLARLQDKQKREGRTVMVNLPDSLADRTVDSVLALALALSQVSPAQRHNGTEVVDTLLSLKFEGVSGAVEFDENGDRANPQYTVLTLPRGTEFIAIGTVSPGSADFDMSRICYAGVGCGVDPPSEKYPVPSDAWQVVLLVVLGVMLAIFIPLAYRLYIQHLPLKRRLKMVEERIQEIDSNDGAINRKKKSLYKEIARLLDQPRPMEWTDAQGLVPIPPTEKEYWDVLRKMRATTNDEVWISQLNRVQNGELILCICFYFPLMSPLTLSCFLCSDGVWSHYVFRKNNIVADALSRMAMTEADFSPEAFEPPR